MSLKNRVWLLCGIGLGLLLPLVVKSYEVLTLNSVRPICVWLLWPTSILLRFAGFATGIRASVLFLATVVGNAILFGFAAALLRRAFIGLVLLMALLIFLFLPPSDSSLAAQFEKHRPELQRLVD